MKKLLPDKVAIIDGGATGMGRSTALLFAEEGCRCVIADINEVEGEKTAAEATEKGSECIIIRCDITEVNQIKDCVAHYRISLAHPRYICHNWLKMPLTGAFIQL